MTDFAATKAQFHLPAGMIYLDGNSLGPLPVKTAARVAQTVTAEWGEMLISPRILSGDEPEPQSDPLGYGQLPV